MGQTDLLSDAQAIHKAKRKPTSGSFKPGQSGNPGGRPQGARAMVNLLGGKPLTGDGLTECEVRERFRILNELYRWFEVVYSQEGYPDFILRNRDGGVVRCEIEVKSLSFVAHGHNPDECDLLICWYHNWEDCKIPVIMLSIEWGNYLQFRRAKAIMI